MGGVEAGGGVQVRISALSVLAAMPDAALLVSNEREHRVAHVRLLGYARCLLSPDAAPSPRDNETRGTAPMLHTRQCVEYALSPAENVETP